MISAALRATLYRLLRSERRPKDAHRADRGLSRTMPADEIEWWCEVVAAMKSRTTNRQGRRLSTKRILEIVTEHGVETPDRGLVKLPPDRLAASALNRHMRQRGYDTERTTAGRVQAKARGVKFGRRAAFTPHQQAEALQRLAARDTQRTVAALLGVDQATISRLYRNRGTMCS